MYISSDTSVWIDFRTISALEVPFILNYDYVMSNDAIQDELLSPIDLKDELLRLGLKPIELDDAELNLVYSYGSKYPKLSVYDMFAMAIAKNRSFILLTGDGNLRKAASLEDVIVKGTLWVLDELFEKCHLSKADYEHYLLELQKHNNRKIRLPAAEIQRRIDALK